MIFYDFYINISYKRPYNDTFLDRDFDMKITTFCENEITEDFNLLKYSDKLKKGNPFINKVTIIKREETEVK